jgi:hypothetical protein
MMKNFIFALLAFMTLHVHADQVGAVATGAGAAQKAGETIKIDPINKTDPMRVTLVGACWFSDSFGRVVEVRGYKKTPGSIEDCDQFKPIVTVSVGGRVELRNANQVLMKASEVSPLVAAKMMAALSTAGKNFPVTIEVSRETFEIERIVPTQDLLSQAGEGVGPNG